jgi:hypothetical protein
MANKGEQQREVVTKKGAAVAGGSRDYREASNRVDRSHSVSRKLDTPQ